MDKTYEEWSAEIPGWYGKKEDYQVSIQPQLAFLQALPERDSIADTIGRKYKLDFDQIQKLAEQLVKETFKHDDHKKQIAVGLAKKIKSA